MTLTGIITGTVVRPGTDRVKLPAENTGTGTEAGTRKWTVIDTVTGTVVQVKVKEQFNNNKYIGNWVRFSFIKKNVKNKLFTINPI